MWKVKRSRVRFSRTEEIQRDISGFRFQVKSISSVVDFNFTLKPTQGCLHRSALPHYCPRTKRTAVYSQWRDRRGAIRPLFPSSIAESAQSRRGWEGKTTEEQQLFKSNAGLCGLYWRPNKGLLERVFCHLSCPLLCAVLQFNTTHRNSLCTIITIM